MCGAAAPTASGATRSDRRRARAAGEPLAVAARAAHPGARAARDRAGGHRGELEQEVAGRIEQVRAVVGEAHAGRHHQPCRSAGQIAVRDARPLAPRAAAAEVLALDHLAAAQQHPVARPSGEQTMLAQVCIPYVKYV